MGAVSGVLGLAGGANGTGFAAPSAANIANPTTADQISESYKNNQNSLASQQALLQALQAQNGLGNQSNVYNQLQGVVNGTGPNPAQAMLSQATGQNVANQAALMAGQRGAASNVGLIARQAAMQGGALQQQAAGQGAALQAQQSLNALTGAGNLATTQANNQIGQVNANTTAQQAEQNALLNAQSAYNNAQVGSQTSQNAANANLAAATMGNQAGLLGGLGNAAGAGIKMLMAGSPAALPGLGAGTATAGGGVAAGEGLAGAAPVMLAAQGGEVPGGPQSSFAQYLSGAPNAMASGGMTHDYRVGGQVQAKNASEKAVVSGNSYANDKIPAVLSEGEFVIDRETKNDKGPLGEAARRLIAAIEKSKGKPA